MGAIFQDGITAVEAAEWNKLLKTDGTTQFQILGYRVYYASGWNVWTLSGNTSSYADLSLTWDNTLDLLEIDLSGLSASDSEFGGSYPAVIVSPSYRAGASLSAGNFIPQAHAIGINTVNVRFYSVIDGAHQTSISDQMDFNILLFGHYDT